MLSGLTKCLMRLLPLTGVSDSIASGVGVPPRPASAITMASPHAVQTIPLGFGNNAQEPMPQITPRPHIPAHFLKKRQTNAESFAGWASMDGTYYDLYCASGYLLSLSLNYAACCPLGLVCNFPTSCAGTTLLFQSGSTTCGDNCNTVTWQFASADAVSYQWPGCDQLPVMQYWTSPVITTPVSTPTVTVTRSSVTTDVQTETSIRTETQSGTILSFTEVTTEVATSVVVQTVVSTPPPPPPEPTTTEPAPAPPPPPPQDDTVGLAAPADPTTIITTASTTAIVVNNGITSTSISYWTTSTAQIANAGGVAAAGESKSLSSTSSSSTTAGAVAVASSGPSSALIGGAVGGGVGAICLTIAFVAFFCLRRRRDKRLSQGSTAIGDPTTPVLVQNVIPKQDSPPVLVSAPIPWPRRPSQHQDHANNLQRYPSPPLHTAYAPGSPPSPHPPTYHTPSPPPGPPAPVRYYGGVPVGNNDQVSPGGYGTASPPPQPIPMQQHNEVAHEMYTRRPKPPRVGSAGQLPNMQYHNPPVPSIPTQYTGYGVPRGTTPMAEMDVYRPHQQ